MDEEVTKPSAPSVVVNVPGGREPKPADEEGSTPAASRQRKAIWWRHPSVALSVALSIVLVELGLYAWLGLRWWAITNVALVALVILVVAGWRGRGGLVDRALSWLLGSPGGRGGRPGRGKGRSTGAGGSGRGAGAGRGLGRLWPFRGGKSGRRGGGGGHPGGGSGGRGLGLGLRWPFSRKRSGRSGSPAGGSASGGRKGGLLDRIFGSGTGSARPGAKGRGSGHDRKGHAKDPVHPWLDAARTAVRQELDRQSKPRDRQDRDAAIPDESQESVMDEQIYDPDASLFRWGAILGKVPEIIDDSARRTGEVVDAVQTIAGGLANLAAQGASELPADVGLAAEAEAVAAEYQAAGQELEAALNRLRSAQADSEALHSRFQKDHEMDLARLNGERAPRHVEARADVASAED